MSATGDEIARDIISLEQEEPTWQASLFRLFEVVRTEGGVAIIKADGERQGEEEPAFTCVLSRGRLADGHLRRDDASLSAAAAWCLRRYFTNMED